MLDFIDSKYGHRLDLMLDAITDRLEDLVDIHKKATAALADGDKQAVLEAEATSVTNRVKFVKTGARSPDAAENSHDPASPLEGSSSRALTSRGLAAETSDDARKQRGCDTFVTAGTD